MRKLAAAVQRVKIPCNLIVDASLQSINLNSTGLPTVWRVHNQGLVPQYGLNASDVQGGKVKECRAVATCLDTTEEHHGEPTGLL